MINAVRNSSIFTKTFERSLRSDAAWTGNTNTSLRSFSTHTRCSLNLIYATLIGDWVVCLIIVVFLAFLRRALSISRRSVLNSTDFFRLSRRCFFLPENNCAMIKRLSTDGFFSKPGDIGNKAKRENACRACDLFCGTINQCYLRLVSLSWLYRRKICSTFSIVIINVSG